MRYVHFLSTGMAALLAINEEGQSIGLSLLATSDCIKSDELCLTQEQISDAVRKDRRQVGLAASIVSEPRPVGVAGG